MIDAFVQRRRRAGYVVLGSLAGLAAASPFFLLTSGYRLDVARQALYVAILAATWSLLAGVAGQFSFAHVAIAGLGGYASAIWVRDASGALASVYAGILFGTLFAFAVGTVLGLLVLRLRVAYLALFTIAFAEVARLGVVAETDLTGGRLGLAAEQLPGDELVHYFLIFGLLIVVLALIYLLLRSRTGLFLRAMREDEGAASAMGVNVVRLKLFIFAITSLMLGFSASIYAHTTPRLAPERLDLLFMSQVVAVAVIGGIESPLAAAIGALAMFGTLESLRRIQLSPVAIDLVTALLAVAVIALGARVVRARQRSGERFPAHVVRRLPLLGASAILATAFLFAVTRAQGLAWWLVWAFSAAAMAFLAVFISRTYAEGLPGWLERVFPALVAAVFGVALLVRMFPVSELNVELGVWRFAVFGAVLTLTLRFARNGLIHSFLLYFAGRRRRWP